MHTSTHAKLYAANATSVLGSILWVWDQVTRYGPRWELMPPLMIAASSLVVATNGFLDRRQARRHAEQKFRAEHQLLLIHGGFKPGMEKFN